MDKSQTTADIIAKDKLRDQFAMAALTGLIKPMFTTNGCSSVNNGYRQHAEAAYELADAMMEARDK